MEPEILGAIISPILASVLGWIISQNSTINKLRDDINKKAEEISSANSKIEELSSNKTALLSQIKNKETQYCEEKTSKEALLLQLRNKATQFYDEKTKLENEINFLRSKHTKVLESLKNSSVIEIFHQPVLLVGPKGVGKSSLMTQWHAPWNHSLLAQTAAHYFRIVPAFDFPSEKNERPHFACADITSKINVQLKLKVNDFPGEILAQKKIINEAKSQTIEFRSQTGNRNLGIVLVCMFDASEIIISEKTQEYYNGELFIGLRSLVADESIFISRLILVFNKFDLLKLGSNCSEKKLMHECINAHKQLISLLRRTCDASRVCEVFSVLDREKLMNSTGASYILGEAARDAVTTLGGEGQASGLIKTTASNFTAPFFS
jgi:hypothetical protein